MSSSATGLGSWKKGGRVSDSSAVTRNIRIVSQGQADATYAGTLKRNFALSTNAVYSRFAYGGQMLSRTNMTRPYYAPRDPTNFMTDGDLPPTSTTVSLKWDTADPTSGSPIAGYTISWTPATNGGSYTYDAGTNKATIEGLTASTTYTFRIIAYNSDVPALSSPGAGSVVETTPGVGAPADPPGFQISGPTTTTTIPLAWSDANINGGEAVAGYIISWVKTSGGTPDSRSVTLGAVNGYTITSCSVNSTYSITIVTKNTDDQLSPGATITADTAALLTPLAPDNLQIDPNEAVTSTTVGLVWTSSDTNGGADIENYLVSWTPGNGAFDTYLATNALITGLSPDTTYTFTVRASNADGLASDNSQPLQVTTNIAGAPLDPTDFTATINGTTSLDLTWIAGTPGDSGAEIASYHITWVSLTDPETDNGVVDVTGGDTAVTVTGLTAEESYSFTIQSVDTNGNSSPGFTTQVDMPTAGAPLDPTGFGLAGDGIATSTSVDLVWTAANVNGGSAISKYTIRWSPEDGSQDALSSATSASISDLTPGTSYQFTCVAYNSDGTPKESPGENAILVTTAFEDGPLDVGGFVATPTDTTLELTWDAADTNGASAIDYYVINISPDTNSVGQINVVNNLVTYTDLLPETTYSFQIRAVNEDFVSSPGNNSFTATTDASA